MPVIDRLCRAARGHVRLVALLALSAALALISLPLRAAVIHADGPPRNGITVTAEGSATLPPDLARISGDINTRAEAPADALNRNNDTLAAVIAAARRLGAMDQDITTVGVRLAPIDSPQGGVIGYAAANRITVRTTDLTHIGDLIQALVNAGISNVSNVEYALQDPNQLQILATQAAIGNAHRRARAIAASLGVQLGVALNFAFGFVPGPTGAVAAPPPPPPTALPRPAPAPAVAAVPPAPPPVLPTSFTTSTQVTVTYAIVTP